MTAAPTVLGRLAGVHTVWAVPALLLMLVVSFVRPDPAGRAAPRAFAPVTSLTVVGVDGLLASDLAHLPQLAGLATATGALAVRSEDTVTTADAGWATLRSGDRAPATGLEGATSRAGVSPDALQQTGCTIVASGPRTNGLPVRGSRPCTLTITDDDGLLQPGDRATELSALDDRLAADTAGGADVVVVGTGGPDPEQLALAVEIQGAHQSASLVSTSTDRAPYVQLIDVLPTVFARLGSATTGSAADLPKGVTGHAWRAVTPVTSPSGLADLQKAANAQRSANVPVQVPTILVMLVGLALLLLGRYPRVAAGCLAASAGFPLGQVLAQIVPWWRVGTPLLLAVVLGVGAAVGALAAAGRLTPATVAGATLALLAGDLATGGHLQVFGLLGLSPITAGRFIGVGNLAYGILAAATLVLAHRQPTRLAAAAVCALGIVADGFPTLGADLGGTVALTLASAVLLTRGRPTMKQAAVTIGLVVGLPVAAALIDLARPAADRTHLGRFASDALHGNGGGTIGRKIHADVSSLFLNPLTTLVPFLVVAAALLGRRAVHRSDQRLLGALVVAAVAGLLANDSGVACATAVLLLGIPLMAMTTVTGAPAIARAQATVG